MKDAPSKNVPSTKAQVKNQIQNDPKKWYFTTTIFDLVSAQHTFICDLNLDQYKNQFYKWQGSMDFASISTSY